MTSLPALSVYELADGICLRAGRIAAAQAELLLCIAEFDRREDWGGDPPVGASAGRTGPPEWLRLVVAHGTGPGLVEHAAADGAPADERAMPTLQRLTGAGASFRSGK